MKILSKLALALFFVSFAFGCGGGGSSIPASAGRYDTTFEGSEDPISEGGNWINGGTVGLDWTNVSKSGGIAIGHEGALRMGVLLNRCWRSSGRRRHRGGHCP